MSKYDELIAERTRKLEGTTEELLAFVRKVATGCHPDEIPSEFLAGHIDENGNQIGTLEEIQEAWDHYAIETSVDTLRELVEEARKTSEKYEGLYHGE